MNNRIALIPAICVFIALFGIFIFIDKTHSQQQAIILPKPIVASVSNAGEVNTINEEGTRALIIVKLEDGVRCQCAPEVWARKKGDTQWVHLATFPIEVFDAESNDEEEYFRTIGDEWFIESEVFDTGIEYDIKAVMYDYLGNYSAETVYSFKLNAYTEQCGGWTDAQGGSVIKKTPVNRFNQSDGIIFSWSPICVSGDNLTNIVRADSYKVYKNGTIVQEVDGDIRYFLTPTNSFQGSNWKIEAYGSTEPVLSGTKYTKRCDDVLTNLNQRVGVSGSRAKTLVKCEVINNKLRVIVEWDPVTIGNESSYPINYLRRVASYYNFYVGPGIPRVGGGVIDSRFERCPIRLPLGDPDPGSESDPWGETDWTCNSEIVNNLIINKTWINFDMDTTVWPIVTEFYY